MGNGGKQAYAAAISAYALALARAYRPSLLTEEILSAVMSDLKSLGTTEDGLAHWGGAAQDAAPAACPRWSSHCGGDSAAVETTAYALLAILSSGARSDGGHLTDALPAARWLTQQRNSNGGFRSTQDTVVGLESLSSFAALAYQSGVDRRRAAVGTPAWAEVQGLGGWNRPGRLHFNGRVQRARNGRRAQVRLLGSLVCSTSCREENAGPCGTAWGREGGHGSHGARFVHGDCRDGRLSVSPAGRPQGEAARGRAHEARSLLRRDS